MAGNTRGIFIAVSGSDHHKDVSRNFSSVVDNSTVNLYTDLLWNTAQDLLYKDRELTAWQVDSAKRLIRKLYEPLSADRIKFTHGNYSERILLIARYVERDPGRRYVPLPSKFFDTSFIHGFTGTNNG